MSKRSKADGSLTGGTGDVNPQVYRLLVQTTAPITTNFPTVLSASGTATQQFPLPIPRFPSKQGKSIVVEILKIRWNSAFGVNFAAAQSAIYQSTAFLSTRAPPLQGFFSQTDGSVIDYNQNTLVYDFTGITTINTYAAGSKPFLHLHSPDSFQTCKIPTGMTSLMVLVTAFS